MDRVRSEQSGRDRDQIAARDEAVVAAPADESIIDLAERERVVAALGSLTVVQRESIELAYFGGHTYAEVSQLLNVPLGTIRTRIRDGLIRLRDTLGVAP